MLMVMVKPKMEGWRWRRGRGEGRGSCKNKERREGAARKIHKGGSSRVWSLCSSPCLMQGKSITALPEVHCSLLCFKQTEEPPKFTFSLQNPSISLKQDRCNRLPQPTTGTVKFILYLNYNWFFFK